MIIQRLIEAGARTDARYLGGSTPLMIAAAFCNPEVVDILIEVGSNINTRDEVYGRTALMYAVEFNSNAEITKLLIDSGADVNVRDEEGITPLILAAMEGENPDVIKMLLDAGADGRIKDAEGWTAYDYARRNDVIEGTEAYWLLNDARF
jgi:ankyrin repeat protein